METLFDKQVNLFLKELEKYNSHLLNISETLLNMEDVELATTPKDLVFEEDIIKLYHFRPTQKKICQIPTLIVYALVNRETMMDLEESKSLILNLLKNGLDVYIIIWGYPTKLDKYTTLDDYINVYLEDCVDFVRKESKLEKINLLGVCQGGTFSTMYSALHPDKVNSLITMVTPIDFHTDEGLLNIWSEYMDIDLMVDTLGNIPGDFMNMGFLMLKPLALMMDKYVGMVEFARDAAIVENFLKMEKWIFDSPDQAGETFRKFLKDFFQENKLIRGEIEIDGEKVNLKNITMPVLNVYAEKDHLVPPCSSKVLEDYISSRDVTTRSFPVGHIGMYVSSKAQKELGPLLSKWTLEHSDGRSGSKPVAAKPTRKQGATANKTIPPRKKRRG